MNYFQLLSACPIIRDESQVKKWIDGIEPCLEQAAGDDSLATPHRRVERGRKRARKADEPDEDDVDQPCFARLPNTPSPASGCAKTNTPRGHPSSARGRKRPGDTIEHGEGAVSGDRAPSGSIPTLRPIAIPHQPSCEKSSSISLINSRNDLRRLAKPIHINRLEAPGILPPDVRSLHSEIRDTAQSSLHIVPKELRQQLSILEGQGSIPEHSFCATETPEGADGILSMLWNIKHKAAVSTELERDERAWNNFVHTPLLELAFGPEIGRLSTQQAQDAIAVRLEPVMAAGIARDSVPRLNPRLFSSGSDASPVPAWSVPDSSTERSAGNVPLVSERSKSKTVDYVLVLDLAETVPLQSTLSDIAQQISIYGDGSVHVNQTSYPPVCNSPIAIFIATKTVSSQRDPVLQLAVWAAAWHKRMADLRSWMLMVRGSITDLSETWHPKLASLPLIAVTGHDWDVYFACDEGRSIVLRGPVPLGSTKSTLQIFALLASLRAVKKWTVDTFYTGLEAWFLSEQVHPDY
ncbi:hypothetical protein EKO27_g7330 [Xylaria grammica]|uniref:PD-(D/E)XK nuclease-like domain-containing protein n=1 Tax=Xylaria grammica TaxID=363999 RepID=A0A439CZZ1_9PEZI|nr:hypothetical protein EKO27_g7330 [Xylaria grammica]